MPAGPVKEERRGGQSPGIIQPLALFRLGFG